MSTEIIKDESADEKLRIQQIFGRNFVEAVHTRGMKVAQFQKECGAECGRFNGKSSGRDPRLSTAVRIANCLDVSLDKLCGRDREYPSSNTGECAESLFKLLNQIFNNVPEIVRNMLKSIDEETHHKGMTLDDCPSVKNSEIVALLLAYAHYDSMAQLDNLINTGECLTIVPADNYGVLHDKRDAWLKSTIAEMKKQNHPIAETNNN